VSRARQNPLGLQGIISQGRATKTHRLSGLRAELIGRKVEMSQLKEAAQQLLEGKGAIFYITGDAGTGKSRLVEEFKAALDLNRIQWREAIPTPTPPTFLLSPHGPPEPGLADRRGGLPGEVETEDRGRDHQPHGDGKEVIPFIGAYIPSSTRRSKTSALNTGR